MCQFEALRYDELSCDICKATSFEPKLLDCCSEVCKLLSRNDRTAQNKIQGCKLTWTAAHPLLEDGTIEDVYLLRCDVCEIMAREEKQRQWEHQSRVEERRLQQQQRQAEALSQIPTSAVSTEDAIFMKAATSNPTTNGSPISKASRNASKELSVTSTPHPKASKRLAPKKSSNKNWAVENWRRGLQSETTSDDRSFITDR